jgi:hypothetical protein
MKPMSTAMSAVPPSQAGSNERGGVAVAGLMVSVFAM